MGQYLAGSSAIWIIKPVLGLLKIRVLQFSASLMINIVVAKIFVKCQLPTEHSSSTLLVSDDHIRWVYSPLR